MKLTFKTLFALLASASLLYSTLTLASIKVDEGGICPSPSYPNISINKHEEGLVEFSIHVNEAGKVIDVEIIKSSGFKNLDDATKKNFKSCKFPPRTLVSPNTEWVKIQAFKWSIE